MKGGLMGTYVEGEGIGTAEVEVLGTGPSKEG